MCSCRRAGSLSFGGDRGPPGHLDKSDFKLPHYSACLRSDRGVAAHSAASSETSLQCVTDNRGRWRQNLMLNKMNQSKVTWLHSKTRVLPADIQKALSLRIVIFIWCKNIVSESMKEM